MKIKSTFFLTTLFLAAIWSFATTEGEAAESKVFELSPENSVEAVRDQIRKWRTESESNAQTPVLVRILDGSWFFKETIELGPQDSNVTWQGTGKTIFTRGRKIDGWKLNEKGWFETQIPDVADGRLWFEQLYVNNERAVPARTPNKFYNYIHDQVDFALDPATGKQVESGYRAFIPRPEDEKFFNEIVKKGSGENPAKDIQIKFFHSWSTSLHRVASYDPAKKTVLLTGGAPWSLAHWGQGKLRYQIEGLYSALDEPGEFHLSRSGKLTYIPRKGETIENSVFIAPDGPFEFEKSGYFRILGDLDKIAANPQEANFVRNVTFRGIQFSVDPFNLPETGLATGQAATLTPISILIEGAKNVAFENCSLEHTGGYAFWLHRACFNCRISRCFIQDSGAGGIRLGTHLRDDALTNDNLVSKGNTVENTLVRKYGRIDGSSIGIWLGSTSGNKVIHNEIADSFYTGISCGWVWGYGKSKTFNNTIDFNYIHNIGNGVLSDMGGFYSLGISPGTSVSNNIIHDVYSYNRYGRGGWGLYTDEGSSNIMFENNLVYRVHTGTVHQHYGQNNTFRNNILAFGGEAMIQRSRNEEHLSFNLEKNIIVFDSLPVLYGAWNRPAAYNLKNNLYWFVGSPENDEEKERKFFVGNTLEQWQTTGTDQGSIIADPGLVDPVNGDFHFVNNAINEAVKKIGFKPFDFSKAGIDPKIRNDWGKKYSGYVYPKLELAPDAPDPLPIAYRDDFETKRNTLIPRAGATTPLLKQNWKLRVSPINSDGSTEKPVFEANDLNVEQSKWNRLDWFGFCGLGREKATLDFDNITLKTQQSDKVFQLSEDFSNTRSLPIKGTCMFPANSKKNWAVRAQNGNKFLRVNDDETVEPFFNPHFYYVFEELTGPVKCSFDGRFSENAFFQFEGRETKGIPGYVRGPSLIVNKMQLVVNGQNSTQLDPMRWYRFEMEFENGKGIAPPYEIINDKATGNSFLRMNDCGMYNAGFEPHFHYAPGYKSGKIHIAFRARIADKASFIAEGRTPGHPYNIGHTIHFANGQINIAGKNIGTYTAENWYKVDIRYELGENAPKKWTLSLLECDNSGKIVKTIADNIVFDFISSKFDQLAWFGFISGGIEKATIDLDDFVIELE